MSTSHHYDTVAFDKRDNATMLFFARTTPGGDIDDYLLLMRADGEDFDEALYIEINERQFAGHDLIDDAQLSGNMLILKLREPAAVYWLINYPAVTPDRVECCDARASPQL